MELTTHLYLKIDSDVRGPMSANVLQRMFKNNELDSSAQFSFDGNKWASITKLFSARGKEVKNNSNRGKKKNTKIINTNIAELPELLNKTQKASLILDKTFAPVAYMVFALSSLLLSSFGITLVQKFLPAYSALIQIGVTIVPSMLISAVFTHAFGNFFIARTTKLTKNQRYSLAVHMPWNRAPEEWSSYLKNWLYCNDWLVENDSADLLPYIRVFATGKAPETIDEEVDLWQSIMQDSKKGFDCIIGHSVRELACLEKLPAWTGEITPGMNLDELEQSLGNAGKKWAVSLLKRAASRKEEFAGIDLSGDLSEAIFEFHSSKLENGRKFLMVIIRASTRHKKDANKLVGKSKEYAA